jgi:hypothetical protein
MQEINQNARDFLSQLGDINRVDFNQYFQSQIQNRSGNV